MEGPPQQIKGNIPIMKKIELAPGATLYTGALSELLATGLGNALFKAILADVKGGHIHGEVEKEPILTGAGKHHVNKYHTANVLVDSYGRKITIHQDPTAMNFEFDVLIQQPALTVYERITDWMDAERLKKGMNPMEAAEAARADSSIRAVLIMERVCSHCGYGHVFATLSNGAGGVWQTNKDDHTLFNVGKMLHMPTHRLEQVAEDMDWSPAIV